MLVLPVPPSVNHYWIRTRRGHALSREAEAFKGAVALICATNDVQPIVAGDVALRIRIYRPARRGDTDNFLKGILDGLKGHAFSDDKQVAELHVWRFDDKRNPRVEVECEPAQSREPS